MTALDINDLGEKIITGSSNGKVCVWDLKNMRFEKELDKLEHTIEHVRILSKAPERCIVYSSPKPEIQVYDVAAGTKSFINVPHLGQCSKIYVEKSEVLFCVVFIDGTLGIFNLIER